MSMEEQVPVSLSYWQDVRKRFFGNKISIVGLVILVALVLAGIIGALVATNYIEILNSPQRLADVAAAGAYIHNQAAVLASSGAPISASQIIDQIPAVLRKILK